MRKWFQIALALGSLLSPIVPGYAEQQSSDSTEAFQETSLFIRANIDSTIVFVDTTRVGFTPLTLHRLAAGVHTIKLLHSDIENWLSGVIKDTVTVEQGKPMSLNYSFEDNVLVSTQPSGADLFSRDSLLGTTPLFLRGNPVALQSRLTLRMPGYEVDSVEYVNARRGVLDVVLKKKWQAGSKPDTLLDTGITNKGTSLPLYITGISTVLSGAAAAYFKIKADDRFLSYQATQSPVILAETNRLDMASGIALALTEASLGLFTYFLLSE